MGGGGQDHEKRQSSWTLRAGMMTKIEAKPVCVFMTLHAAGDAPDAPPLGQLHLVVKPGTESNQVSSQPLISAWGVWGGWDWAQGPALACCFALGNLLPAS